MIDPSISEFFSQRKEAWLKKSINSKMTQDVIDQIKAACEEKFSLAEWLPDAAKRADQLSLSTHPCTFSHPSARKNKNGDVTPIVSSANKESDGYIRAGNVAVALDALGNAAALDVYSFLHIVLTDGKTVLQHIESDTDVSKRLLKIPTASYNDLRQNFLAIVKTPSGTIVTSSKIKQVYFPVDESYHLLSVLSNSGIMFELKSRLKSSENVKAIRAKRKDRAFSEIGYSEVYNLTEIGYGGAHPKNISVLAKNNYGVASLLASVPPSLKVRDVRFPTTNFFTEALNTWNFKELFQDLHDVLKIELGGNIPRQTLLTARDNKIKALVLKIMDTVYLLREASTEQYRESSSLSVAQKVWLCHEKADDRENADLWLDEIIHDMTRWLNNAYSKTLADKQILIGDEEFNEVKKLIGQWAAENKEFLR